MGSVPGALAPPARAGDGTIGGRDARTRATGVLCQPAALTGLCLLVLNDHVFKARWPGVITGKISDLTWPLVAVPLVALLLAPAAARLGRTRWATLAAGLAASPFVLVNLSPEAADLAARVSTALVGPSSVTVDASDLLALPVFLWPLAQLRRPSIPERRPRGTIGALQLTVLGLAAFGTVATSCFDDRPRIDLLALDRQGHLIGRYSSWEHEAVRSIDAGETWERIDGGGSGEGTPSPAARAALARIADQEHPLERCDRGTCYRLDRDAEVVVRTVGGRSESITLSGGPRDLARRRRFGDHPCPQTRFPRPVDLEVVTSPSGGHRVVVSRGLEGITIIEGDEVRHVGVLGAQPYEGDVLALAIVGPEIALLTGVAVAVWVIGSAVWWRILARRARDAGVARDARRASAYVWLAGGIVAGFVAWPLVALDAGSDVANLLAPLAVGAMVALGWLDLGAPSRRWIPWLLFVRIVVPWAAAVAAVVAWGAALVPSYPLMLVLAVVLVAIALDVTRRLAPLPPLDEPVIDPPAVPR